MASSRPSVVPAAITAYTAAHCAQPDQVLVDLRRRTAELGGAAGMQVSAEQGALLTLITRMLAARNAVEVGTFTGYSSICIARGLAPGGRLLCCDVSEEYTEIARRAWQAAGLTDRIDLQIAPALETLRALPASPDIDLAFIDAEKREYSAYYEELVPRIRPGGVLLVDNTLWSGRVADEHADDEVTTVIRSFNDHVAADDRVESCILAISDGLTLIRKL